MRKSRALMVHFSLMVVASRLFQASQISGLRSMLALGIGEGQEFIRLNDKDDKDGIAAFVLGLVSQSFQWPGALAVSQPFQKPLELGIRIVKMR